MKTLGLAALSLAFALPGVAQTPTASTNVPAPNSIAGPHVTAPPNGAAPTAVVALLSDAGGWGPTETRLATTLAARGAFVIGVDTPAWLAKLGESPRPCVYLTGDIESLSHDLQRKSGGADYLPPLVAGIGQGAAVALAIAAQTPLATFGGTFAVDPAVAIALAKPLCTGGAITPGPDGTTYGLQPGALPDPIAIALTATADPAGAAHAAALRADHPEIALTQASDTPVPTLTDLLASAIAADDTAESADPLGLPITVLETTPTRDTMAVIYSGDGGWRDLDRQIGGVLRDTGMPVVGVDSLRYFWKERDPQETADDLARIIDTYAAHWKVSNVLLIGYSFGADILPATYSLLPPEARAKVPQISLLALGREKPYQISVLGWLGKSGGGGDPSTDIAKIDPDLVQCVYGTEETDDPCPDFATSGVEAIQIKGGHHFDGDYTALTHRILDGLDRRLAAKAAAQSSGAPLTPTSP